MRIATCLLLSLVVGSGLYTATATAWLGLLAAVVMMLPFGPRVKKRGARKTATRGATPPPAPAPAAEGHLEEVDLVLST